MAVQRQGAYSFCTMPLRFIWRNLKTRWRDQRVEVEALLRGLGPTDVALDVGSNKGGYLMPLCRRAAEVIAVEPQADLAAYLGRMGRTWRLGNLKVMAVAASDRSGTAELWIPDGVANSPLASLEARDEGEAHRPVEVPLVRLDDLARDLTGRIGAIKIDVEGHEGAVLAGAVEVLEKHRPVVVCECEERHLTRGTVHDLLSWMSDKGYDATFVLRGRLVDAQEFNPAIHQRDTGGDYWNLPAYANNFVFVPRDVGPREPPLFPGDSPPRG